MTVDPAIGHHHYCGFSSYNKAVWGIRFKLTPFFCQVSTCFQVLCPKLILFLLKRTISHRALFKSYHPLPKHTQMEQSLHQEWSKLFTRQKLWANGSVRHSPFHERASSSWLFAFCFFRHWNTPPVVSYLLHTYNSKFTSWYSTAWKLTSDSQDKILILPINVFGSSQWALASSK